MYAKCPNSMLKLWVFDFLQEHSDFGLFLDRFPFGLKDVEHRLYFIEECSREREGLLVLVVKRVAVTFRDGNAAACVALTAVMASKGVHVSSKGVHVSSTVLLCGEWLNPLFGRIGPQVALKELVHLLEPA